MSYVVGDGFLTVSDGTRLHAISGPKYIAKDVAHGEAYPGPGPYTYAPIRTVTDPFGPGVPFNLRVVAHAENTNTSTWELAIDSPAGTIVQRTNAAPGGAGHIERWFLMPNGGSVQIGSRVTSAPGVQITIYEDPATYYVEYIAYPA